MSAPSYDRHTLTKKDPPELVKCPVCNITLVPVGTKWCDECDKKDRNWEDKMR